MSKTTNRTIDRKFRFNAVNPCNGKVYTQNEGIVFLAKDNLVIPMLHHYLELVCHAKGPNGNASDEAESIRLMIDRVIAWRKAHPERCKLPDITGDIERQALLAPNEPILHHPV